MYDRRNAAFRTPMRAMMRRGKWGEWKTFGRHGGAHIAAAALSEVVPHAELVGALLIGLGVLVNIYAQDLHAKNKTIRRCGA